MAAIKDFKLNPLLQINEFDRLNLCDPLSSEAQTLWFVLFRLFNRSGWPSKLTIMTKVLEDMCRLNRQKICTARESLIKRTMIIYYEKSGSASPDYKFLCLYQEQLKTKIDSNPEHKLDTNTTQPGNTHIYIKNKTKREKNANSDSQIFTPDFVLQEDSFKEEKYEAKLEDTARINQTSSAMLFQDSPCSNKEYFLTHLLNTDYGAVNLNYYYEIILNWSNSKQAKNHDWMAFAKNWILKDYQAGKLVTLNNFSHGTITNQQSSNNGQSYSELGNTIDEYFNQKYDD